MSVLIKKMDMPKRCYDCEFMQSGYPDWCDLSCMGLDIFNPSIHPNWCPLVEVKTPHGRLVEAKVVKEKMKEWLDLNCYGTIGEYYFELMQCIDDTPTVIDAEEEEE